MRGSAWIFAIRSRTRRSARSCASGSADVLPTLPPEPAVDDWPARREYDTGWQRRLFEAGYAGINWPTEYGGRGATLTEQLIYLEETTLAGAPYVGVNFVGLLHAGPDDHDRGQRRAEGRAPAPHPARRRGVVPGLLASPPPGSDLGSLQLQGGARRRRVRHHRAEDLDVASPRSPTAASCCVRTDPDAPKHKGITWLMFPMDTPGIEIRADQDHRRHRPSSARCSSTRPGCRSPTGSATRTTAGASPW